MRSKKPGLMALKRLYELWVAGVSLRSLAEPLGVRHSTLRGWLQDTYGNSATDPVKLSLAKSLVDDYEDQPEVKGWVMDNLDSLNSETVQHRSEHSIRQLSRYQTVRDFDMMDCLAIAPDDLEEPLEAWDFLRLPLTLAVLEASIIAINTARTATAIAQDLARYQEHLRQAA